MIYLFRFDYKLAASSGITGGRSCTFTIATGGRSWSKIKGSLRHFRLYKLGLITGNGVNDCQVMVVGDLTIRSDYI